MGLALNTGHLAVRGEPVEPPATHADPEPFDKLRANGGLPSEQHWGSPANTVDAPIEGIVLDINEASQSMLVRLHNPCHSDPREGGGRNLKISPGKTAPALLYLPPCMDAQVPPEAGCRKRPPSMAVAFDRNDTWAGLV